MCINFHCNNANNIRRTLPQEDLTVLSCMVLLFNSSASPHVQSLHAFRLFVVEQTEKKQIYSIYINFKII